MTVKDMWNEYKKITFGRDIGNISAIQLIESEKVFYAACGKLLVELRDNVSLLPEDQAVDRMQSMFKEVTTFFDKAVKDYNRSNL